MDNRCMGTEQKVLAYCIEHAQLPVDTPLCVAVSGGADSMALLRMMQNIAPARGIALTACHVNHCLRGAAADADEAFVRAQCAALGVPLTVYNAIAQGDTPPPDAGEQWAREVRYRYFAQITAAQNALLATAHTLNDQAETLLFRLARGTGVHGAAGIRATRGQYCRPLLCLTRAEVEQYCADVGQPYITDETNFDLRYARNQLRHHALPSLCDVNEAAVQHLGQFCEQMAALDDYFEVAAGQLLQESCLHSAQQTHAVQNTHTALVFALAPLQQAHPLLLARAMYQLVRPIRDAERKYADALCNLVCNGQGAVQLTDSVRFAIQGDYLVMQQVPQCERQRRNGHAKTEPQTVCYPAKVGRYTFPSGFCVQIEKINLENTEKIQLVHKKDLKNYADYDKIEASLVLRTRQQGDCFSPVGRGVTKTVKKLHNELGIPEQERGAMPLLADGHTVVWLWGQGFAQGYAPSDATTTILKMTEEKHTEERKQ